MNRAAIAEQVLRARLEEAGLEIQRGPFNVSTTDGPTTCTVVIVIPGDLIDETERLASDPVEILRDRGAL